MEVAAALLVLVSVCLMLRESVWGWPVGAVAVLLYGHVYYESRLYANMGLQAVNLVLQCYGWHRWVHGGRPGRLPIRRATVGHLLAVAIAGLAGTAVLGLTLGRLTDAAWPFWDAAISSLSLLAQWLLARKLLESWLVWGAVDLLSIGIYLAQAMYPSLLLYGVLLALSVLGYRRWKKTLGERGGSLPPPQKALALWPQSLFPGTGRGFGA